MDCFSSDEIQEFEAQNQMEAIMNYLKFGQPLCQRHRLYINEKERKLSCADVPPSPNYQPTHSWETYQQPIYQIYDQTRQSVASTCGALTDEHQRPSTTGDCLNYSAVSPDKQPLTAPALSFQVPLNDQTSTMKTMMQLGDNKRNIQVWSPRGSWQGLKAILDTGTEENWISKKVADRLNLPIKDGVRKAYTDFQGKHISSVATTEVVWCLDGWSTSETTIFRVAESPRTPFDVLFGRNIMSSGEVDFWGENNTIQPVVQTEITATEKQEIAQEEARADAESKALGEKRKQHRENKGKQAGREKKNLPKGPRRRRISNETLQ